MLTVEYCRLMADYNQWMNARLFDTCASLSAAQLHGDQGAFFKSIYATLNHIAYGDLAFLSRFTGTPGTVPELGADLFGDFARLHRERTLLDARICTWSAALTESWLAASLTYTSKVDGLERTVSRWILVAHLFNHQTHHRGQVTTLLSQAGLDMGSTDIPFMPCFVSGPPA
jgi:uncharacterized damage-inducible protein DinB